MNQKQRWNNSGYDAEEFYFEKLNRELIQKLKVSEVSVNTQAPTSQGSQIESKGATVIAFPIRETDTLKKVA